MCVCVCFWSKAIPLRICITNYYSSEVVTENSSKLTILFSFITGYFFGGKRAILLRAVEIYLYFTFTSQFTRTCPIPPSHWHPPLHIYSIRLKIRLFSCSQNVSAVNPDISSINTQASPKHLKHRRHNNSDEVGLEAIGTLHAERIVSCDKRCKDLEIYSKYMCNIDTAKRRCDILQKKLLTREKSWKHKRNNAKVIDSQNIQFLYVM